MRVLELMGENGLLYMLASSKMRRELLLYLEDGPKTLSDLKDHLGVTSPQLSIRIRELLEYNLISAERKTYSLTQQGRIVLANYRPFANTAELFDRHCDYWKTHDLNCVPEELRYRIGEICNSEFVRDDTENLNRTLQLLLKIWKNAKQIYGVSPIFDYNIVRALLESAKQGVHIEMVLTRAVYQKMASEHPEMIEEFLCCDNFHDYIVDEDIKTPFILTDRCFYFSNYYNDGTFDTESNLVSEEPLAIKWGRDLFEYYKSKAVKL